MREHLQDIVDRLITIKIQLGHDAFLSACRRARLGIGTAALERAEMTAKRGQAPKNRKLTKERQVDSSSSQND